MGFPNRNSVGKRIISENPQKLTLLGSGWEGSYSLEDSLAAGALAAFLIENNPHPVEVQNDELMAALALWNKWQDDVEGCLRTASHGKRLIGLGNHDADFKCCSTLDQLDVVPFQVEPGVLIAS